MSKQKLIDAGFDFQGTVFDKKGSEIHLMDADTGIPTLVTESNAGVPVELLTNFSNTVIEIRTEPRNATKVFSETVVGDWTLEHDKYREEELNGTVAPYSDFGNAGVSDINTNWIANDFYRYQTLIRYGELEAAKSTAAKFDLIGGKQRSGANTLAVFANRSYLYGIQNLQIFGILNHPMYNPVINSQSVGGNTSWADKGAMDIYEDIRAAIGSVIDASAGLIDQNSTFKLPIANTLVKYLDKLTEFNTKSVWSLVRDSYPNAEFITVPEFSTDAGDLMYVVADNASGQPTGECVTNMRMKAFSVIPDTSSFKQKVASGTGGFRLYQSWAVSRLLVA